MQIFLTGGSFEISLDVVCIVLGLTYQVSLLGHMGGSSEREASLLADLSTTSVCISHEGSILDLYSK